MSDWPVILTSIPAMLLKVLHCFEDMNKTATNCEQEHICPICSSIAVEVVRLPEYPVTELLKSSTNDNFQTSFDQSLSTCTQCSHSFLNFQIHPTFLYGSSYLTRSNTSVAAISAIDRFLQRIKRQVDLSSFNAVIDVGANDLSLLNAIFESGFQGDLIGIDPIMGETVNGIVGIKGFGEQIDYESLGSRGTPRLFLSSHTFEHIVDPSILIGKIADGMTSSDVLVIQVPSIEALVHEQRFDQVHHQHLHYFSLKSLNNLLELNGLFMVKSEMDWLHYGAWVVIAQKADLYPQKTDSDISSSSLRPDEIQDSYQTFMRHINLIDEILSKSNYIAFGGGLMLPIIAYYIKSMWTNCIGILDDDELKNGWHFEKTPMPITSSTGVNMQSMNCLITGGVSKTSGRKIVDRLASANVKNIYFPTPGF
jgi:hypothetical protein